MKRLHVNPYVPFELDQQLRTAAQNGADYEEIALILQRCIDIEGRKAAFARGRSAHVPEGMLTRLQRETEPAWMYWEPNWQPL